MLRQLASVIPPLSSSLHKGQSGTNCPLQQQRLTDAKAASASLAEAKITLARPFLPPWLPCEWYPNGMDALTSGRGFGARVLSSGSQHRIEGVRA
jgi:hypothetical protein